MALVQRGFIPYGGLRAPKWPFEVNKDSPQAQGLLAWWPIHPRIGDRSHFGNSENAVAFTSHEGNRYEVLVHGTGNLTGSVQIKDHRYTCDGASVLVRFDIADSGNVFAPAHITVGGRLNLPSDTTGTFIGKGNSFDFGLKNGNTYLHAFASSGKAWSFINTEGGAVTTGVDHTMYLRYDGVSLDLFLDGKLDQHNTAYTGGMASAGNLLEFLDRVANQIGILSAYISDLRIYNSALPDAVMQDIHAPSTRWDLYWQPRSMVQVFTTAVAAGFVPYPRYAMTGGMQPMRGGV